MSWLAAALAAVAAVPGVVVAPAPDHNTLVAHRALPRCTAHRRHHCTRHPTKPARQVAPPRRVLTPPAPAPVPLPGAPAPSITATPTATATATPVPPPRRTSVTMDDTRDPWTLVPARFTLGAGTITLTAYNFGMDDHNLSVDSASRAVHYGSIDVPAGSGDDPPVLSVDLPAGKYVLFCDLPGHEAAGMSSTITVQ